MAAFDLKDKKNIRNVYCAVAILLCVVSSYLFYDLIWTDFQTKKQNLIDQQKSAQAELDKIEAQRSRVPMLESALRRAEVDFERLKEMFPEAEKVPNRLQDLYTEVRESGVTIQSFKPNGPQEKEFYVENNYSFNVNAGYHTLGALFAGIANLPYPTTIDNLKLNRSGNITQEILKAESHGEAPLTINVSFDLTTFTSRNR
jgi:type IV pilus assembly protein PilO